MRALPAILTGAALLLAAGGCTGGGAKTPSDPQELADRALAAMADLDSYRAELDFGSSEAGPLLAEFVRPQSYRLQGGFKQQQTGTGEPVDRVIESIYIDDGSYHRECEKVDVGCGEWEGGEAYTPAPSGPSPLYLPQWPLAGLDLADDLKLAGREDLDGQSMLKLTGTVNHIRAVMENIRSLYAEAGVTAFGQDCQDTPDGGQTCRDLTYDEALQQQEPALTFYDSHPGTLEVWLSAEDYRVRRVQLTVPPFDDPSQGGDPSSVETSVTFSYSKFNDVTIKAPI